VKNFFLGLLALHTLFPLLLTLTACFEEPQGPAHTLEFLVEGEVHDTVVSNDWSVLEKGTEKALPTYEDKLFVGWFLDMEGTGELTYERSLERIRNAKESQKLTFTARYEATSLLPRMLSAAAYTRLTAALLASDMSKHQYDQFCAYYNDYSSKNQLHKDTFPILNKVDKIYVLDQTTGDIEIAKLEGWLKTYYPAYGYPQLQADYAEVDYLPS
jgi:hypothetical protein